MRKLFVLLSSGALLVAGVAGAAPLNYSGTSTLLLGDFPPAQLSGGGVATINGSGGIGGHLNTVRVAASRGVINGDLSLLVTDPVSGPANSIALIQLLGVTGGVWTGAAPTD